MNERCRVRRPYIFPMSRLEVDCQASESSVFDDDDEGSASAAFADSMSFNGPFLERPRVEFHAHGIGFGAEQSGVPIRTQARNSDECANQAETFERFPTGETGSTDFAFCPWDHGPRDGME